MSNGLKKKGLKIFEHSSVHFSATSKLFSLFQSCSSNLPPRSSNHPSDRAATGKYHFSDRLVRRWLCGIFLQLCPWNVSFPWTLNESAEVSAFFFKKNNSKYVRNKSNYFWYFVNESNSLIMLFIELFGLVLCFHWWIGLELLDKHPRQTIYHSLSATERRSLLKRIPIIIHLNHESWLSHESKEARAKI